MSAVGVAGAADGLRQVQSTCGKATYIAKAKIGIEILRAREMKHIHSGLKGTHTDI